MTWLVFGTVEAVLLSCWLSAALSATSVIATFASGMDPNNRTPVDITVRNRATGQSSTKRVPYNTTAGGCATVAGGAARQVGLSWQFEAWNRIRIHGDADVDVEGPGCQLK